MHLSSLSKDEIKVLLIESISRLDIKNFIFQYWKTGSAIQRYNIERNLRRSSNDERENQSN
jgi:hypothetical protein